MILGLGGSTIWTSDINNLLPFYRDSVGLAVTFETPGYVILGPMDGFHLGIGTHSDVKGPNMDPARHMVGFETDDIVAEVQRMKANGVRFISEPTKGGPVTVATFVDPEGNYNQLAQFG